MYFCKLINYLAEIQYKLSKKVIRVDTYQKIDKIAGIDISFSKNNLAIAAAVIIDLNTLKILEKKTRKVELLFPYIPGFLGFRESNAMISVVDILENDFDVAMINGHGILHPRNFGLASHVGVLADMPTVGVAKKLIVGNYINHDNSFKLIRFMNQTVGVRLSDKFVSIGHKISLKTAKELVLKTLLFKMPEPLRQAHILATKIGKRDLNGN
jgi:deoxyinosine 3'endonuclease (endonuclease V)